MAVESLADKLSKRDKEYGSSDPVWVQYVRDHFLYLREVSTKHTISDPDMFRFEFRPEAYLESQSYPPEAAWIILLINQLDGKEGFSNLRSFWLPNLDKLKLLRSQYLTYVAQQSSADAMLVEATGANT